MGWATLIGFPLLGFIVLQFFGSEELDVFNNVVSVPLQLLIGLAVGTIMGFIALGVTKTSLVYPAAKKYEDLIREMNLDLSDILFLSICAGFGEEVFFRGVLQEFWGVWITAFVFVAIHGYLNPKNWRLSIYGLIMTIMMAGIGYMKIHIGLWSSIISHSFIDFVLFYFILFKKK